MAKSSGWTNPALPAGPRRNKPRRAPAAALAALLAAALACGGGGSSDVQVTVNAVNTAVERTLAAMTQAAAGTGPAPATATNPAGATEPAPAPTLTSQPSPTTTDFVPPSPTALGIEATPTATTTDTELARPNGAVVRAPRAQTPPTIDAQFDDWPSPLPNNLDQVVYEPGNWAGLNDQSATYGIAWDASYLYLMVIVVDDIHVQLDSGETLYRGDSLELQLDADLAGDFDEPSLNADDFQLGLSPGADGNSPELWLWNPPARRGAPAGIVVASRGHASGGGYALEAAIPWSFYGITPAAGNRYGFALNSSDNDSPGTREQQTMISSVVTRTLLDPTTWGTLALDP